MRQRLKALLIHTSCALGIHAACALGAAPASAMQILEAADHAELRAEVSATAVSRIAVAGDRIARVVRAPGGFEVEHDPKRGDLYLRPLAPAAPAAEFGAQARGAPEPVTLFVGTERGFTYRLTLDVADRGSAQILIRNADAGAVAGDGAANPGAPRIATLAALVRAVARREPLPGYAIASGGAGDVHGAGAFRTIETWRGPRFTATVLELRSDGPADAAALAARLGPGPGSGAGSGVAAAWASGPGTAPGGGRLAVIVREHGGAFR